MIKTLFISTASVLLSGIVALTSISNSPREDNDNIPVQPENEEKSTSAKSFLESRMLNDSVDMFYVNPSQVFEQQWAELSHPNFWKQVMRLSEDSCIVNVGQTRQVIEVKSVKDWRRLTDTQKNLYRDSIRTANGLTSSDKILLTIGKREFYDYTDILSSISRGVKRFDENGVDPWYAQAILMIESPGKIGRSSAGAYGPFQLMPGVARNFGLTVGRYTDERRDFDKSAKAASRLISEVCIPEAKKLLDRHELSYEEQDLWFRLFVMHIYHAGAGNVSAVVNKINPDEGGMQLIQKMWVTEAAKFRNASQNYSQLALAAMMILDEMIWEC